MLAVTDSGTGMPQSVIERAFEPFFTTKEIGRGTGLGLSMVYGFAKQSGGHLKIYSEVGHGTTVKLYLPRATDPAEARAGESNDTAPVPVGSETILVVEDNEALRRTTVRMLTQLGYTVLEAEAGQAALDVLHEANGVDLILTDIVMPKGMSGYDLAEMASEIWPHIRILFMSGYSEHFLNKLNVRESRIHLITKPFRKQDLARKLRSILDGVPT
jgi:CheY-like chemotaxis protein